MLRAVDRLQIRFLQKFIFWVVKTRSKTLILACCCCCASFFGVTADTLLAKIYLLGRQNKVKNADSRLLLLLCFVLLRNCSYCSYPASLASDV